MKAKKSEVEVLKPTKEVVFILELSQDEADILAAFGAASIRIPEALAKAGESYFQPLDRFKVAEALGTLHSALTQQGARSDRGEELLK